MLLLPVTALVALTTATTYHTRPAELTTSAIRRYIATYNETRGKIPAWARKYGVTCNFCHSPAVPRLNGTGIKFRWAGYRMPAEIGQKIDVGKVSEYMSFRGRVRYGYEKTQSQPVSESGFSFHDATLFYSGAFGTSYSAFFEVEREAEYDIGLTAHMSTVWGNATAWGGFRFGLMHWLLRDGVAGFDRPTGIRTPTPLASPLTATMPFKFSKDQLGLEAYYVVGQNRLSAELLNGVNRTGSGGGKDTDVDKDFVITDQLLFDDRGSGLTLMGYYGSINGLDTSMPNLTSHFWRTAISANKIFPNSFELLGGLAYGKDTDLPTSADTKGFGYWGQAQYMIPPHSVTLFGRWEFADPDTDVDDNANRRFVFGGVVPLNLPEYLRLALEYALDFPQGPGSKNTNGFMAEMMLNF